MTTEFHVLPYGERWQLSRDGSRVALLDTQAEAIAEAHDRAGRDQSAKVVVHDASGHVQPQSPDPAPQQAAYVSGSS
jgi:hypothetical protein